MYTLQGVPFEIGQLTKFGTITSPHIFYGSTLFLDFMMLCKFSQTSVFPVYNCPIFSTDSFRCKSIQSNWSVSLIQSIYKRVKQAKPTCLMMLDDSNEEKITQGVDLQFVAWSAWRWLVGPGATFWAGL